jgi:hypothetical protein
MSRSGISDRPQQFTLANSRQCSLAKGLVFAGLGRAHGSTQYYDSSGRGNNGTLTNMDPATDWVWSSELGRWVLDFDGSNDEIRNAAPTYKCVLPFTISWWMNSPTPAGAYRYIAVAGIGATSNFSIAFASDGRLYYYQNSAGRYVTYTSVASVWEHHSICFSDTAALYYVNGVSQTIGQPSGAWGTITANLAIGSLVNQYFYLGRIGDLVFHNRILPPAEIQILANRSDPMLGGLILPPRRKLWAVSGGAPPASNRRRRVICGA